MADSIQQEEASFQYKSPSKLQSEKNMADAPSASTVEVINEDKIRKELFRNASSSQWDQVVNIYWKYGSVAHQTKITENGDTAIRFAITEGEDEVVKKLIDAIVASGNAAALGTPNNNGDTALHLAAFRGNATMCRYIAEADQKLIGRRNKQSETPFFLAVHYGNKEAFLCLHRLCSKEEGQIYGRRGDGETILHTAISRQYYDIAFEIINRYPKLAYSVNEKGFSPLHALANTPYAFESGTYIKGWVDNIIYYCVCVNEFEWELINEKQQTCIDSILYRIGTKMGFASETDQQSDLEKHNVSQGPSVPKPHHGGAKRMFKMMLKPVGSCLQCASKAVLWIICLGKEPQIEKMRTAKEKNVWSRQILRELVYKLVSYSYEDNGRNPYTSTKNISPKGSSTPPVTDNSLKVERAIPVDKVTPPAADNSSQPNQKNVEGKFIEKELDTMRKRETPILIAAKNGITEIVKEIFERFQVAIYDTNNEKKNVLLLAVENRQYNVFNYLHGLKVRETIFSERDNQGNSALHLAATLNEDRPWYVPGAALQMQWERRWYEFVEKSMPEHFFAWYNNDAETPNDVFKRTHKDLLDKGSQWLSDTSQSFSVVAGLIATVAFATASVVPGGVEENTGNPRLGETPAFTTFAISSLVGLCFSILSVIMFLAVLISKYQSVDFGKELPRKFMVGLTSMFVCLAAMLISFCAGHSFVFKEQLKYAAFPVYTITCFIVIVVVVLQFPFYFDLLLISFHRMPRWRHK